MIQKLTITELQIKAIILDIKRATANYHSIILHEFPEQTYNCEQFFNFVVSFGVLVHIPKSLGNQK